MSPAWFAPADSRKTDPELTRTYGFVITAPWVDQHRPLAFRGLTESPSSPSKTWKSIGISELTPVTGNNLGAVAVVHSGPIDRRRRDPHPRNVYP